MPLRVVSFESRRGPEIAQLIRSRGGDALVAPSMREVALGENRDALAFGKKLLAGEIDGVIFTTGVGAQTLLDALETAHPKTEIVRALSKISLYARGPKPLNVLKTKGLPHTIAVPEPATWREILTAV